MNKEELYIHYKTLGNDEFKKQSYVKAIEHYTIAINEIFNESNNFSKALSILYSNRAQCQLKLENYGLAIDDCNKSLDADSKFVKSLYRRAVAHYAIRELEKGLNDCKIAKKISPNDIKIKDLYNEINIEIRTKKFEDAIDVVEKSVFTSIDWENNSSEKNELNFDLINKDTCDIQITNLNKDFILKMIEKFKNGEYLNKFDAYCIVNAANTIFKTEESLVDIGFQNENFENVKKISICGDTHGQFYDVLNIFEKYGDVDDEHVYLFNGDFVDRGSWGCEVALLLYSLKIYKPNKIFINRGNHETDDMNLVYGFKDECKFKYNEKLFKCFSESFGSLPYCTLINKEYLVMHGGLFSEEDITIDDIKKINRFKNSNGNNKHQPPKKGIEMELLWTDPQDEDGLSPSKRGIGMQFGPDITERFCKKNGLKAVIRSHEVRDNGYEWQHNNKLCTVFSAPNYCDVQGNKGGILEINRGPDAQSQDIQCFNFDAVPHPNIPPMKYTKNQFGF